MMAVHSIRRHEAVQDDIADPMVVRLIEFVRYVRGNNFKIGIQEELDALKVANHCNVLNKERMRWGLRSLLCTNSDDWERFDTLFDVFWSPANRKTHVQSSSGGSNLENQDQAHKSGESDPVAEVNSAQVDDEGDVGEGASWGGASSQETHYQTDFQFITDSQQMRMMEQMVERLARRIRRRLTRRKRARRRGLRIHMRRTIRKSLSHGGIPLELVFQQRQRQLPRLILLLDVSRSMSLYSYLFLRFARGIVQVFKDADAFVYHTRLVHVTDALHERDINIVKKKLALMSAGWSGGTRIGECLQTFNREYGRRILNSRSIVIHVSDGFDTGPPELLAEQLQLIKRRAKRLVWLNPLLGREGYQPIAGGMQAALPWIDLFASAHNLESLLALEGYLGKL